MNMIFDKKLLMIQMTTEICPSKRTDEDSKDHCIFNQKVSATSIKLNEENEIWS